VKYCQEYFDFSLPSVLWAKCVAKFEVSFERFFVCAVIIVSTYCCLSFLFGKWRFSIVVFFDKKEVITYKFNNENYSLDYNAILHGNVTMYLAASMILRDCDSMYFIGSSVAQTRVLSDTFKLYFLVLITVW